MVSRIKKPEEKIEEDGLIDIDGDSDNDNDTGLSSSQRHKRLHSKVVRNEPNHSDDRGDRRRHYKDRQSSRIRVSSKNERTSKRDYPYSRRVEFVRKG